MPQEIIQFCGFFHELNGDPLKFMSGRQVRAVARKANAPLRLVTQVCRIRPVVFSNFHAAVPMIPQLFHVDKARNIIPRDESCIHKY